MMVFFLDWVLNFGHMGGWRGGGWRGIVEGLGSGWGGVLHFKKPLVSGELCFKKKLHTLEVPDSA